ncbi:putative carbonic anhydrase 3 [Oratosquilla oratoria]|uniref:putative carbonic anhydrase 3 n=1 Tax=Oratosquilla oratoria TaxID=337810 RepID=UPI003F76224D
MTVTSLYAAVSSSLHSPSGSIVSKGHISIYTCEGVLYKRVVRGTTERLTVEGHILQENHHKELTPCPTLSVTFETQPKRKIKPRTTKASQEDDWSFQGKDTGPETWATNYPGCGTSLQSPIDLPSPSDLDVIDSEPIKFVGYDKKAKGQYLYHDGWAAKLLGNYKKAPSISGGLLDDTYKFLQLHFHWSTTDEAGSEHNIGGEASPLEIHFVHQSDSGALAVLGIKTYIDEENARDSVLFPLWPCFVRMEKFEDKCPLKKKSAIVIEDLLPSSTSRFYRYMGSTTVPPCIANVTWTVFEEKLPISRIDTMLLRSWIGKDGIPLVTNNRPIQDTGDREILLVEQ